MVYNNVNMALRKLDYNILSLLTIFTKHGIEINKSIYEIQVKITL